MWKLVLALLLLASLPASAALRSVLQVTTSGGTVPTVQLNFGGGSSIGCTTLTSCLTVTRATQETCTDVSGNITYAANNVACTTTGGLQVYPAATNLLLHSPPDGTNWTLTNVTQATNATPPDGNASTAETLTDNNTNGQHATNPIATISVTSGTNYTLSCFVKGGTLGFAQITGNVGIFSGLGAVNINLSTGVTANIGSNILSSGAIAYTNGWWRVYIQEAATATSTGSLIFNMVTSNAATRNLSYVGTNSTIQLWGCQVETSPATGPIISPYIPTTTATVTRNADNIATTSTLSTTLNSATGTVVANTTNGVQSLIGTIVDSNGTTLLGKTAGNVCTTALGAALSTANTGTWTGSNDCGLAWNASGGVVQLNGGSTASDAQARTPSATGFIGSTSGTSNFLGGNIAILSVYNTKLASPQ